VGETRCRGGREQKEEESKRGAGRQRSYGQKRVTQGRVNSDHRVVKALRPRQSVAQICAERMDDAGRCRCCVKGRGYSQSEMTGASTWYELGQYD